MMVLKAFEAAFESAYFPSYRMRIGVLVVQEAPPHSSWTSSGAKEAGLSKVWVLLSKRRNALHEALGRFYPRWAVASNYMDEATSRYVLYRPNPTICDTYGEGQRKLTVSTSVAVSTTRRR
jgi:DNA gyrase inhibitor GyrI